ncbi:hypothetical protein BH10CHL1_BH10CHL1_46280 [soil metagenome]
MIGICSRQADEKPACTDKLALIHPNPVEGSTLFWGIDKHHTIIVSFGLWLDQKAIIKALN